MNLPITSEREEAQATASLDALMSLVSEYGQQRWSEGFNGALYDAKREERMARAEAADLYQQIKAEIAALLEGAAIADEAARTDIECHALIVSAANPSVYDIGALEPNDINDEEMEQADMEAIARAVTYLEARGLLRRPVDGAPNLVSFA